jgi:hypothetical protein
LGYVSFGAFEDDIDHFSRRLQEMGIKRLDPPPGIESNGLWFRDHNGVLLEIKVAAKSSPEEKTHFGHKEVGPGQRGAPFRSTMPRTRPRRLSRSDVHRRRSQGDRVLHPRARHASIRSFQRQYRVYARHPR